MPEKCQANAQSVEDTRTPEKIAEERIAAWKHSPKEPLPLNLMGLGLKKVPETLREVRDLELLNLRRFLKKKFPC